MLGSSDQEAKKMMTDVVDKKLMVPDRYRSQLVENTCRFAAFRGFYGIYNNRTVEGVIVDHFYMNVHCDSLTFHNMECLSIFHSTSEDPKSEWWALSETDQELATTNLPICLVQDLEVWDI